MRYPIYIQNSGFRPFKKKTSRFFLKLQRCPTSNYYSAAQPTSCFPHSLLILAHSKFRLYSILSQCFFFYSKQWTFAAAQILSLAELFRGPHGFCSQRSPLFTGSPVIARHHTVVHSLLESFLFFHMSLNCLNIINNRLITSSLASQSRVAIACRTFHSSTPRGVVYPNTTLEVHLLYI